MPVELEQLSDDELRTTAQEAGVEIAEDADRATIIAAIKAKQAPPAPWGDPENFNAEKAAKLIENLRSDREQIKTRLAQLEQEKKERDDAEKTELQLMEETATGATQRAAAAERELMRLRVAVKKNLTDAQAKRLVGETEEELEADADELLAEFTPEDTGQVLRRPTERLRPGAAPSSEPEETDPAKLAAMVRRPY